MRILKSKFEQAVADSKKLPERPDNKTFVQIYLLYKQATEGDITAKRPGLTGPGRPREMGRLEGGRGPTRRCRPMSTRSNL